MHHAVCTYKITGNTTSWLQIMTLSDAGKTKQQEEGKTTDTKRQVSNVFFWRRGLRAEYVSLLSLCAHNDGCYTKFLAVCDLLL